MDARTNMPVWVELSCTHKVETHWDYRPEPDKDACFYLPYGAYCKECKRTQTVVGNTLPPWLIVNTPLETATNEIMHNMAKIDGIELKNCTIQTQQRETEHDMLESEIRYHRDKIDELERKAALAARFGENEDYANESVIFFKRNFDRMYKQYTYAAVKAGGFWYITGRSANGFRISFVRLVEDFLIPAKMETGEVWFATKWEEL